MHEIFKEVAAIYLKDGAEKVHNKEYKAAIIDLDKALNLNSSLNEAYFYKGYATRELHLFDESIVYFKEVLCIDHNHLAALIQMSYSLCSLNRNEEALIFMNRAIEIDSDWHTYMYRAAIRKSLGDLEGAKMDEDAAWEIGSTLPF
jgi:tetratricopeptide (TPR) repeat protein